MENSSRLPQKLAGQFRSRFRCLQKTTEAPSSITIVTADDIQKYGYRSLPDILRSVRGFYISYDRNYSYLGVRGFSRPGDYNTRILLLVDGHRTNDNVYDLSLIGNEFPLSVDLIERVEVIRGPSSSLYGTSAFFAVINIITKRGSSLKGFEVTTDAAALGTGQGQLSYGNKFHNGLEMLLSGSFSDSQGEKNLYYKEFDDPRTNKGIAENADGEQYHRLFASVSYKDWSTQAVYGSREKGIPTGAFGTFFNDSRNRTNDIRGYLDLKYDHTFAKQWNVQGRVYYDQYTYRGAYIYDYSESGDPPFLVDFQDHVRGEYWGGELQASKALWNRHKITAGTEYRDNFRQNQTGYDAEPFYDYLRERRQSGFWATYLQDEFTVHQKLTLNLGIRHDQYETFGGTTNPRLALIFNPVKKTAIKYLYGGAFRAPSSFELFYSGVDFKPSLHLKPETIKTNELVLEQQIGRRFRLEVAGYSSHVRNLISQVTDPADGFIMFNNTEHLRARGIELDLEGKPAQGLRGRVSYAFQQTQDKLTRNVISNSPKHLAKFSFTITLLAERVFAGFEGQYMSRRRTVNGDNVPHFFISNLTLFSGKLGRGVEMSASLYNVFNTKGLRINKLNK